LEEFIFYVSVTRTVETFLHINTLAIITILLKVNKTIGFITVISHFGKKFCYRRGRLVDFKV